MGTVIGSGVQQSQGRFMAVPLPCPVITFINVTTVIIMASSLSGGISHGSGNVLNTFLSPLTTL